MKESESAKMSYKVTVLYPGYSKEEEGGMMANCSCTLITGKLNVIVDTMTPWDKDKIIKGLADHDLIPDDIDYVICTHGHSDHIGNNNLFLKAKHIVGLSYSFKDHYYSSPLDSGKEFILNEGLKILPTPGHTLSDVSVIVNHNEITAITGDLFEKEEDIENEYIWRTTGSEDPEKQEYNRQKIIQMADYIIPGHGPMFKVTASMKQNHL
ncbi:metallo-beta-lactamase domain-containing protein 1-like isoform X7 [Lycorma delicatula]|uniref:metallo-beta-lactamase domain-containing protein 1-like isoform X7 n=1 Tax=Lycorma delicatula TaxID=130591 RepID=UPI003F50EC0F